MPDFPQNNGSQIVAQIEVRRIGTPLQMGNLDFSSGGQKLSI